MSNSRILVTGASGQLGRLVIDHLLSAGVAPNRIIATTRNPSSLTDLTSQGVEARAADFNDVDSLEKAFVGADVLLLVSTNSLEAGQRITQHLRAVEAVKEAKVGHIVYTSMPNADTSHVSFAPDHAGTEAAIRASGLPFTILRNQWYAENLLLAVPGALAAGTWYTAAGSGRIAYIARADLAFAASVVLRNAAEYVGEVLDLTGAVALTTDEVAAKVSAEVGKPLNVVHVPLPAIIEGLTSHGFPISVAEVFASFDTATAAGDLALVTGDFERITGREPQTFEAWLAENRAAFTE